MKYNKLTAIFLLACAISLLTPHSASADNKGALALDEATPGDPPLQLTVDFYNHSSSATPLALILPDNSSATIELDLPASSEEAETDETKPESFDLTRALAPYPFVAETARLLSEGLPTGEGNSLSVSVSPSLLFLRFTHNW
jgi:hypothetical protein